MKHLAWSLVAVVLAGACSSAPGASAQADDAGEAEVDAAAPAPRAMDAAADKGTAAPADAAAPADVPPPVDAAPDAPPVATPEGWWDAKWSKRGKVTISDPELKETLTDFQVPLALDPTLFAYAAARTGGQDLRFVGPDGKVVPHQIDTWAAGGASLVWLRLPALGAAPVVLWMYYGNPDAPPPGDAEVKAVWPEPYTGVWHLSGDAKDSTALGHDGVQMAGGAYAEGKLGQGFLLDGGKRDHITLKADIKLVAGAAGCTFSAWINPTRIEASVNGMIIMTVGKWFNNNHNSYADFNINAAGQMISHIDPGTNTAGSGYARILSDAGFIKTNEWAWVTYVIDLPAKEERFFKNGQLVSTKPPPAGKAWAASFIDMVSSRVVIGAEEDVVSHFYTGRMDELRIEKGMRSAAWIAAQHRSMTTPGYVKLEAR